MVYEIAGLKVEMEPKFGRLTRQSASYVSSGAPALHVKPDPADEARVLSPSPEEREYICCCVAFCRGLIAHGRFFLHASAVVHEGGAYLFSGPSGVGKSTHTALWCSRFPGSYILNDDKPVLWPEAGQITVWGSPFAGKTDLQVNRGVPLRGICFLRQGEENHIAPLTEERALAALLDNTWRPGSGDALGALLGLLEQVVANTAIYEMRCTAAPEAAALSCRVMKGM